MTDQTFNPNDVLAKAEALRGGLSTGFRDEIVKSLYSEAETIAKRAVKSISEKNTISTKKSTGWSLRRSSGCLSCWCC